MKRSDLSKDIIQDSLTSVLGTGVGDVNEDDSIDKYDKLIASAGVIVFIIVAAITFFCCQPTTKNAVKKTVQGESSSTSTSVVEMQPLLESEKPKVPIEKVSLLMPKQIHIL